MAEADRQVQERFNVRIKSKDKALQRHLNQTLPERIYLSWLSGKENRESEIEYGKLKENFVIKNGKNFMFAGLENLISLQLFDGKEWKTINIAKTEGQSYLQLDKTKFFGKNFINLKELKNLQNCLIIKGE